MALIEATGIKKYLFQLFSRESCAKYSEDLYVKNIFELGFSSSNTILIDVTHTPLNYANNAFYRITCYK